MAEPVTLTAALLRAGSIIAPFFGGSRSQADTLRLRDPVRWYIRHHNVPASSVSTFPRSSPLPGVPGMPGGPTVADRFPGRTTAPAVLGSVLSRVIGWGAGALFYPREAGRGSDLCTTTASGAIWCETPATAAMPAPALPGTRGPGRRPRIRPGAIPGTPPRRRERRPRAVAPPRPRSSGPVTIVAPRPAAPARVIDVVRPAPRPSSPPIARPSSSSWPTTTSSSSWPASVPMPATIPAARTALPAWLPTVAAIVTPSIGAWVGATPLLRSPLTAPRIGPAPQPSGTPRPQLAPQLAPLTSFHRAVAHSPAQELDRQCRERAKQKRKKRKPRSECYRGTYVELRNGTRKTRKEKISCQ